jgi:hypothetical protein
MMGFYPPYDHRFARSFDEIAVAAIHPALASGGMRGERKGTLAAAARPRLQGSQAMDGGKA